MRVTRNFPQVMTPSFQIALASDIDMIFSSKSFVSVSSRYFKGKLEFILLGLGCYRKKNFKQEILGVT